MNFDLYANKHCHCQVGSMLQKTFAGIFSYYTLFTVICNEIKNKLYIYLSYIFYCINIVIEVWTAFKLMSKEFCCKNFYMGRAQIGKRIALHRLSDATKKVIYLM